VVVRGEVDIATGPRLTAALDQAIRESVGTFIVDLCDVDFLDSSGVSVLLRARAMLGRDDRQLAVICSPGPVRRTLEITNIDDLLVLYDSRERAAASLRPRLAEPHYTSGSDEG
jgi:anti-anti-sigma factor